MSHITKTTFIKSLVLFSSISLVVLFLCYRSGLLDSYLSSSSDLQNSPNGGVISNTVAKDSSRLKTDSSKLLFSSSKVIILTDKKFTLSDTSKTLAKPFDDYTKEQIIMSSSKSSLIFQPGTINPKIISLLKKYDSLKVKP